MNIDSIISRLDSTTVNATPEQIQGIMQEEGLRRGLEALKSAAGNSMLSGEVLSVKGNEILLSLGDNNLINARLEGNIDATVGKMLTFSISSNDKGTLILNPLFQNTAIASTVNNALEAANIPQTPQNQYMVKTMMEEGLPVDRQSLYNMSRAMVVNSSADVLELAAMTRLNIPLTPEMVEQFSNYTNFKHEITNAISQITDTLFESFESMTNGADTGNVLSFLADNIMLLAGEYGESIEENVLEQNILQIDENTKNEEIGEENNNESSVTGTYDRNVINTKDGYLSNQKVANGAEVIINTEKPDNTVTDKPVSDADIRGILNKIVSDSEKFGTNKEYSILQDKEYGKEADAFLKQLVKELKMIDSKNLSYEDYKAVTDEFRKILDKTPIKDVVRNRVLDKMLLEPEAVADKENVSKLYEKINEQVKTLSELVNRGQNQGTTFSNAVNNLNSNIDFMNQLNQTFSYIQLPLKMAEQDASGELYVYTRKKSLSLENGTVSAFLHLDMDHLGPVDVNVIMNDKNNVNTRFTVADDKALELIYDNIDKLNARLEKRGYSMSCEFDVKKDEESILEKILNDNKNISLISTSAFDARA